MLVPLYGFLRGDTLGLVVLVHDYEPVREVAVRLLQAASMRVRSGRTAAVYFRGDKLDSALSVADAGLTALDRVDVVEEGG